MCIRDRYTSSELFVNLPASISMTPLSPMIIVMFEASYPEAMYTFGAILIISLRNSLFLSISSLVSSVRVCAVAPHNVSAAAIVKMIRFIFIVVNKSCQCECKDKGYLQCRQEGTYMSTTYHKETIADNQQNREK